MADGALLLVDAAEGPLPQTRFVLRKCLELGFPVIVVINKIDRRDARPDEVLERGLRSLLRSRGHRRADRLPDALRRSARDGIAKRELDDDVDDARAALRDDPREGPAARGRPDAPLQILVSNLDHDDYVGRLAIGRIVARHRHAPTSRSCIVEGRHARQGHDQGALHLRGPEAHRRRTRRAAGEIVAIAGIEDVDIGDTIADSPTAGSRARSPRIVVEQPTIKMQIGVNTSPFAGKMQGVEVPRRAATSASASSARRGRTSPSASRTTESPDTFIVLGRGELQLAILVETMRREGYEMQLGNPEVVTQEIDGVSCCEPIELVVVDVPDAFIGIVTERLGERRGRMIKMTQPRLRARAPRVPRARARAHRLPRRVPHRRRAAPASSTRCSTAGSRGAAR